MTEVNLSLIKIKRWHAPYIILLDIICGACSQQGFLIKGEVLEVNRSVSSLSQIMNVNIFVILTKIKLCGFKLYTSRVPLLMLHI